jgi:hypothetical protein
MTTLDFFSIRQRPLQHNSKTKKTARSVTTLIKADFYHPSDVRKRAVMAPSKNINTKYKILKYYEGLARNFHIKVNRLLIP